MAIDDEGYQVAVAYANRMGMHTKIFTLDSFREYHCDQTESGTNLCVQGRVGETGVLCRLR